MDTGWLQCVEPNRHAGADIPDQLRNRLEQRRHPTKSTAKQVMVSVTRHVMRRSSCEASMLGAARPVGARFFAYDQPVVNIPPVIRAGVRCIDPDLLHGIDPPAVPARPSASLRLARGFHRQGVHREARKGFALPDSADNVDPRDDGAEDLLRDIAAEADPALDLPLMPDQFDMGERVLVKARRGHGALPAFSPRPGSSQLQKS
jgi:hypothetical protein